MRRCKGPLERDVSRTGLPRPTDRAPTHLPIRGLRLALVFSVFVACERRTPSPSDAAAPAPSTIATDAASTPGLPDAAPVEERDDCGPITSKIKSAKSIGHTSVVYKIELEDGTKHAWKPNAKIVKERWRGEVAAYRLGRALGVTNVPPACARSYALADVVAVLGRPAVDALIASGDGVEGAVIPWIQGLQFLPLEKEPLRADALAWLRDRAKPVPAEKLELAAQLSTLVVFDFLTSNWDRYSGANVGLDASGKKVLFIDNDAAFMSSPPANRLRENQDALARTERFSGSLYTALRSLDDDARLREAFGLGLDGLPLLSPSIVSGVRERVATAVAEIGRKVAARSEADVLVFP